MITAFSRVNTIIGLCLLILSIFCIAQANDNSTLIVSDPDMKLGGGDAWISTNELYPPKIPQVDESTTETSVTVEKSIHFIHLGGVLSSIQQRYIESWGDANPDYRIHLWTEPDAVLSKRLGEEIRRQAEQTAEPYRDTDAWQPTFDNEMLRLQNEADSAIASAMNAGASSSDFDQAATDYMVEHLSVDSNQLTELKSNATASRTTFINGQADANGADRYVSGNLSDLFQEDGIDNRTWFYQELGLRNNLEAAANIAEVEILKKHGGVYVDIDTLPGLNPNIYNEMPDLDYFADDPLLDPVKVQLVMERLQISDGAAPVDYAAQFSAKSNRHSQLTADMRTAVSDYISAGNHPLIRLGDISMDPNGIQLADGAMAAPANSASVAEISRKIERNYRLLETYGLDRPGNQADLPFRQDTFFDFLQAGRLASEGSLTDLAPVVEYRLEGISDDDEDSTEYISGLPAVRSALRLSNFTPEPFRELTTDTPERLASTPTADLTGLGDDVPRGFKHLLRWVIDQRTPPRRVETNVTPWYKLPYSREFNQYAKQVWEQLGEIQKTSFQILKAQHIQMMEDFNQPVEALHEDYVEARDRMRAIPNRTAAQNAYLQTLESQTQLYERMITDKNEYLSDWNELVKRLDGRIADPGQMTPENVWTLKQIIGELNDYKKSDNEFAARKDSLTDNEQEKWREIKNQITTWSDYLSAAKKWQKAIVELAKFKSDLAKEQDKSPPSQKEIDRLNRAITKNQNLIQDSQLLFANSDDGVARRTERSLLLEKKNLSLSMLNEPKPGYVRLYMAIAEPESIESDRFKDIHMNENANLVLTSDQLWVGVGTPDRSIGFFQNYRMSDEPKKVFLEGTETTRPIELKVDISNLPVLRSVLVKKEFVKDYMFFDARAEDFGTVFKTYQADSTGALSTTEPDSGNILLNTDLKVRNQFGVGLTWNRDASKTAPDFFDRLSNAVYRGDTPEETRREFQTIGFDDFKKFRYDSNRDGTFVNIEDFQQSLGFGKKHYLLNKDQGIAVHKKGGKWGSYTVSEATALVQESEAFFDTLNHLEGQTEALEAIRDNEPFIQRLGDVLEANHLTPGAIFKNSPDYPGFRRDEYGAHLPKSKWESEFADSYLNSGVWHEVIDNMSERLSRKLTDDARVRDLLSKPSNPLAKVLENSYVKDDIRTLRKIYYANAPSTTDGEIMHAALRDQLPPRGAVPQAEIDEVRAVRMQLFFHVLRPTAQAVHGNTDMRTDPSIEHAFTREGDPTSVQVNNRTDAKDAFILINPDSRDSIYRERGVLLNDKYRSHARYTPQENNGATQYMRTLDVPFTGGVSGTTRDVSGSLDKIFGPLSSHGYWTFQTTNSAFMIRNGYHSFFETMYVAARYDPLGTGQAMIDNFDRLKRVKANSPSMDIGRQLYQSTLDLVFDNIAMRPVEYTERPDYKGYTGGQIGLGDYVRDRAAEQGEPGATDAADESLVDLQEVKRAAAEFFGFPDGKIPADRDFNYKYYGSDEIEDYITAHLNRQGEADNETNRSRYRENPSNLPPAFADRDGTVRVFDNHPNYRKNGHLDDVFYKSVLVHEAVHAVSHERGGLQSYSTGANYNWDEAVTDYFGEQVAKKVFGDDFAFRTNYYTDSTDNGLTLRGQLPRHFNDQIDEIKNYYAYQQDEFQAWLDSSYTAGDHQTRSDKATELISERDPAVGPVRTKINGLPLGWKNNAAKMEKINRTLEPHGLSSLTTERLEKLTSAVFGRETRADYEAIYRVSHPEAVGEVPRAFIIGDVILALSEEGGLAKRTPSNSLAADNNPVNSEVMSAIIADHIQHSELPSWVKADTDRVQQASDLMAEKIIPKLGTGIAPLQFQLTDARNGELQEFKTFLNNAAADPTKDESVGELFGKTEPPEGWSSPGLADMPLDSRPLGQWADISNRTTIAEHTAQAMRYDSQIILQMENDPIVRRASERLAAKHPGKSVVLQFDPFSGDYRPVYGDLSEIHGRIRWQAVGHGRENRLGSNTTMAGRNAEELAADFSRLNSRLANEHGVDATPERISLAGCSLSSVEGRLPDFSDGFIRSLKENGIVCDVSSRSATVDVGSDGRKYTRSTEEWLNKAPGTKTVRSWREGDTVAVNQEKEFPGLERSLHNLNDTVSQNKQFMQQVAAPVEAVMALAHDHAVMTKAMATSIEQANQEDGKTYEVDEHSVQTDPQAGQIRFTIKNSADPTDTRELVTNVPKEELRVPILVDEYHQTAQQLQNRLSGTSREVTEGINRGLAIYGIAAGLKGGVQALEQGHVTEGSIALVQSAHGIGELTGLNKKLYKAAGRALSKVLSTGVKNLTTVASRVAGEEVGQILSREAGSLLRTAGEVGELMEDVPIVGTAFGIYNVTQDLKRGDTLGYIDAGLDGTITALSLVGTALGPESEIIIEPIVIALTIIRMGIDDFYNDIKKELDALPPDATTGQRAVAVFKGMGEATMQLWEEWSLPGQIFAAVTNSKKLDKEYEKDQAYLRSLSNYHNYFSVNKEQGSNVRDIDFANGSASWNGGDIVFQMGEDGGSSCLRLIVPDFTGANFGSSCFSGISVDHPNAGANNHIEYHTLNLDSSVKDIVLGVGESNDISYKEQSVKFLWFIPVDTKRIISDVTADVSTLHGTYYGNSEDNRFIAVQEQGTRHGPLYFYKLYGNGGDDTFQLGAQQVYAVGGEGQDYYITGEYGPSKITIDNNARDKALDTLKVNGYLGAISAKKSGDDLVVEYEDEEFYIKHQVIVKNWFLGENYRHLLVSTKDDTILKFVDETSEHVGLEAVALNLAADWTNHRVDLNVYQKWNHVVIVTGSSADEEIIGNELGNNLDGGGGRDLLVGGKGMDQYHFNTYSDRSSIVTIDNHSEDQRSDILYYDANFHDIQLSKQGSDLILHKGSLTGDRVTVQNWYLGSAYRHLGVASSDHIVFKIIDGANGAPQKKAVSMDLTDATTGQMINLSINAADQSVISVSGSRHADTIIGNDQENYIDGGGGADAITGGNGADTYVYNHTPDSSTITIDNTSRDKKEDYLLFKAPYDDITTARSGSDDLRISKDNRGVTIRDFFVGEEKRHLLAWSNDGRIFTFDDSTGAKKLLLYDFSAMQTGQTLMLSADDDVARVTGSSHTDVFFGNDKANYFDGNGSPDGASGDSMLGGGERDTYIVKPGYGHVTIRTYDTNHATDYLDLQLDVAAIHGVASTQNDESLFLTNYDLTVEQIERIHQGTAPGPGDDYVAVRLEGWFKGDDYQHLVAETNDGFTLALSDDKAEPGRFAIISIDRHNSANRQTFDLSTDARWRDVRTVAGSAAQENEITGNAVENQLSGGQKADRLIGLAGDDTLKGYEGDDLLEGGLGRDSLSGDAGSDTLLGGPGDDVLIGGLDADTLDGGIGDDIILYAGNMDGRTGVAVDLLSGAGSGADAEGDRLIHIENIKGTTYGDVLQGNDSPNTLYGETGGDTLEGRGGDDILIGGPGADILKGGDGFDTALYSGDAENSLGVQIHLEQGVGAGADAEGDALQGVESIRATPFNDFVFTDAASNNHVDAGDGDDFIQARGGMEQLIGGGGQDVYEIYVTSDDLNSDKFVSADYFDGHTVVINNQGTTSGMDVVRLLNLPINELVAARKGDGLVFYKRSDPDEESEVSGRIVILSDWFSDPRVRTITVEPNGSSADRLEAEHLRAMTEILTSDPTARLAYGENLHLNLSEFNGRSDGDFVVSTSGNVVLNGFAGRDALFGGAGDDVISGGDDDDYLEGGGGYDRLWGDGGHDTLSGGPGPDKLEGGPGSDTASYATSEAAVAVKLTPSYIQRSGGDADGDLLSGIENLEGSSFNDLLFGDSGDNILTGGPGADVLDGKDGTDTASYISSAEAVRIDLSHNGSQTSTGDAGGDELIEIENIIGSAYNDRFNGNSGANLLDGGAGIDTVFYSDSSTGVTIDLSRTDAQISSGDANGDRLIRIENVQGGPYDDALTGNSSNNVLEGGAGADRIDGGAGNDTASYASSGAGITVNLSFSGSQLSAGHADGDILTNVENIEGSRHDDIISGDSIANRLSGGEGDDTVSYADSPVGVTVDLSRKGAQRSAGDAAGDRLDGFENVTGSAHDDTLAGDRGANRISGGNGIDTVSCSNAGGGVTIDLSAGVVRASSDPGVVDTLTGIENAVGSNFDDAIIGNTGVNRLSGGAGRDTISYENSSAGVTVDLSRPDAQTSSGDANGDTLSNFENVKGSVHADTLSGDDADNRLDGGAGADALDGRGGVDIVSYLNSPNGVGVNLSLTGAQTSIGDANGDVLSNIESIVGSPHNDRLTGDDNDNTFYPGGGNDRVDGGDGVDVVSYENAAASVRVHLGKAYEVKLDQASRSAAFRNSVGCYIKDESRNLLKGRVLWADVRGKSGLIKSELAYGVAVERFGLFLIPNGAALNPDLKDNTDVAFAQNSSGRWTAVTASGATLAGERTPAIFSDARFNEDNWAGVGNGVLGDDPTERNWWNCAYSDPCPVNEAVDPNEFYWQTCGYPEKCYERSYTFTDILGETGWWTTEAYLTPRVIRNFVRSEAGNDNLFNIEQVIGSKFDDVLIGDGGDNQLSGHDGDDTLDGAGGNDVLKGGVGNDVYVFAANAGRDTVDDARGADIIRFEDASVTADSLHVTRLNSDLNISLASGGDPVVVVKDHYRWLHEATYGSDYAASVGANVGSLVVGSYVQGEIGAANDRDWYAIDLVEGRSCQIDLMAASTRKGTLGNPRLVGVYDSDGLPVRGSDNDNGGDGLDSRIRFQPPETGRYYISAGAVGAGTGSYTLSVGAGESLVDVETVRGSLKIMAGNQEVSF